MVSESLICMQSNRFLSTHTKSGCFLNNATVPYHVMEPDLILLLCFHCTALHVFFNVKYCLPMCFVFCGGFPACFLGSLASDTPETAFILQVNGYL